MLGIDYGTKRVGVAIGDSDAKTAVPFCVVNSSPRTRTSSVLGRQSSVHSIVEIVKKEQIELVVMGQGGKGPMEKKVQEFAKQLRKFVPVEIADEHFTTAQVERAMKGYGKARKGVDTDSAAAGLILQSWLDSR